MVILKGRWPSGPVLLSCDGDWGGIWMDDIPDGNDYSIDTVWYAVVEDVLRGQ